MPKRDNLTRVTMDRQVLSEPSPTGRLSTQMTKPLQVWGRAVVLELKFTDRYPNWFRDLVQIFELSQCGAAKYADGVTLMSGQMPQHRRMPQPNHDLQWSQERGAINAGYAPLVQGLTRRGDWPCRTHHLSGLRISTEGI